MKPPPVLIVITGLPGSGKTALARNLAEQFQLPMIHKDGIKETLFNAFGWSDEKWSRQLSYASFKVQFYTLGLLLKTGLNCIAEGNFDSSQATPEFEHLRSKSPFQLIQILCYADGETLWQRFEQRANSPYRHPGHTDSIAPEQFKALLLAGRCAPLALEGTQIEVDTTDFDQVDFGAIASVIATALDQEALKRC